MLTSQGSVSQYAASIPFPKAPSRHSMHLLIIAFACSRSHFRARRNRLIASDSQCQIIITKRKWSPTVAQSLHLSPKCLFEDLNHVHSKGRVPIYCDTISDWLHSESLPFDAILHAYRTWVLLWCQIKRYLLLVDKWWNYCLQQLLLEMPYS